MQSVWGKSMSKAWFKDNRFGSYVRNMRLQTGKSMNETARELGIQSSYMHEIEVGTRGPLKYPMLDHLATYLDFSQEEREKMFDLEGVVRGNVPSDIQEILKNNSAWVEIIRRFADLSEEHKNTVLEKVRDEISRKNVNNEQPDSSVDKAKTVAEYYALCNKLKDIIRTGWKNWNVKRERLESVAEHIFGVQTIAMAMWSQYHYDVDIYRVIMMITVHELEEVVIGDLTQWDIEKDEKTSNGHKAVHLILKDLLQKEEIEELIFEFDARQTKEALFAYHCDKLECDIQSKLYDEEGCVDLDHQEHNPIINDAYVQELLRSGKTWSEMWMEFGRQKYNYDSNFVEVSNYVEKNNIGAKKKV